VIVYKFGGALARTRRGVEALAHITHLAHRSELARTRRSKQSGEQHGLVVVVSAIGHATRNLSRAAELAEDGKLIEAESLLDKIVAQHQQLATSLGLDEESLESAFEGIASSVRALLEGRYSRTWRIVCSRIDRRRAARTGPPHSHHRRP
jgi:aspartokinase